MLILKKQFSKYLNKIIVNNTVVVLDYNVHVSQNDMYYRLYMKKIGFLKYFRSIKLFRGLVFGSKFMKELKVFLVISKVVSLKDLLMNLDELYLNNKFFKVVSVIYEGYMLNIYKKKVDLVLVSNYEENLSYNILFLFLILKIKIICYSLNFLHNYLLEEVGKKILLLKNGG